MPRASKAEATVVVAMATQNGTPTLTSQRGEEGGEPCEGHLAQGELTQPAGEHRERRRANGESQHSGIELLPRRLGEHERNDHGDGSEQQDPAFVDIAGPPHGAQTVRDRVRPGAESEHAGILATLTLGEAHRDEHGHEQQQVSDTGHRQEVVREHALNDADRHGGDDGHPEGPHAGDHRRREGFHEGLRAQSGQSGRRRGLPGDQDDRQCRQSRRESPHHGRHQFGRDGGQPRQ